MTAQSIHALEFAGFVIEAAGILLLFREVRIAHKIEGFHSLLARKRQGEFTEALADERDSRDARALFVPALSDVVAQASGLQSQLPDSFARKVLGLNQSPRREDLTEWFVTEWTTPAALTRRRRILALGVALLLLVVLLHAGLFLAEPEPVPEHVEHSSAPHFRPIHSALVFDPGKATLTYAIKGKTVDLTQAACSVKKELAKARAEEALVIGHHDQTELTRAAQRTYASNQGLAQQRAEEVKRYLTEDNKCGPALLNAITLIAGPRNTGERARQSAPLAEDRTVEVWALTTAVRE